MASTATLDLSSKRRRFQPPITTFFTPSLDPAAPSSPSHLSHNHYAAVTHSPHPVVPAKVQASLLSVGMRVRKSIADGYKTNLAKAEEKHTAYEDNKATFNKTTTTYTTLPNRSELAPFCGMSKSDEVLQPFPHPTGHTLRNHSRTLATDETEDALSLPPSSQESVDSELSTPTVNILQRKRTHGDFDIDPYEDELEQVDLGDDENMSQTWHDPLRQHPVTHITGRTILSPSVNHQRRRAFGLQNYKAVQSPMDLDDFEEPAFLRKREEVDMDVEV